jgi:hypothetical protein
VGVGLAIAHVSPEVAARKVRLEMINIQRSDFPAMLDSNLHSPGPRVARICSLKNLARQRSSFSRSGPPTQNYIPINGCHRRPIQRLAIRRTPLAQSPFEEIIFEATVASATYSNAVYPANPGFLAARFMNTI